MIKGFWDFLKVTTVQIMTFQHVNRCLKSEPLAERPKSKRESGLNMPILQFHDLGACFNFEYNFGRLVPS